MARKQATLSPAHQVMARVNQQMKSEVLSMGNDKSYTIQRIPTGSLMLDRLTGGGFARGRHVEISGAYMTGKSLLAYQTLVLAQKRGEVCAVVDGERVFSEKHFRRLGGNPKNLILYRPATANELANVLQLFVQNDEEVKGVDICLIDSVASMLPIEELEHSFTEGDARVASLARLMSQLLRKITSQNDKTLFIWTNQMRDKISRIPGQQSTPGGRALGYYASTRIEMNWGPKETIEREMAEKGKVGKRKVVLGRWIHVAIKKEKTGGRPEDTASFFLDYDTRLPDPYREVIDLGLQDGFLIKKKDHFEYETFSGELVRCHGVNRMVTKLKTDDDLMAEMVAIIEERTAQIGTGEDGT